MARQPRLDVPGIAQHVVQRGNDRQPCFAAVGDCERYPQELVEASLRFGCAVHAYVLMTNHVHLLVTPAERGALSRMMQAIGRRYVAAFNARYRRTGTLCPPANPQEINLTPFLSAPRPSKMNLAHLFSTIAALQSLQEEGSVGNVQIGL